MKAPHLVDWFTTTPFTIKNKKVAGNFVTSATSVDIVELQDTAAKLIHIPLASLVRCCVPLINQTSVTIKITRQS